MKAYAELGRKGFFGRVSEATLMLLDRASMFQNKIIQAARVRVVTSYGERGEPVRAEGGREGARATGC